MLRCCEDAVAKLEYSCRVVILPVAVIAERNSQVFVDERAIIVHLPWVLWSQRARSRSTRYLQISRWQFRADSSIILKFIALRFFSFFFFSNSSLVDSTYDCKTGQNATFIGQERQGDVQLKVC